LGKNESQYLILGVVAVIAVFFVTSTGLAFGTHKDYLWEEGYALKPSLEGKPWIAGISYQDPIVKDSPECMKTGGNASPDCHEASLYQITVLENWAEIGGTHQVQQCSKLTTIERDLTATTATLEESFNKKISNTIRHESSDEYNKSMQNELTTKIEGEYSIIKASAEHKLTINQDEKHTTKDSSERSEEIEQQTGTSFTVHTEQEKTVIKDIDLTGIKMQYMEMQKFTTVKYDLWTPVTNTPGNGFLPEVVKVLSPEFNFVGGEEPLPYKAVHIFKAHDLPGDQYYIHVTHVEEYPTTTKNPREERANWDCKGETTEGRIPPASHPEKRKNIDELNVFFRPTTNHANIIVVDNELKPVSGAKVTLGIPSIPLRPGADACTSIDNWVKTDKFGSAYFYLESEPPNYVYDDLENAKSKGLVALFQGNGDSKDVVFPDRKPVIPAASFEAGIVGEAFEFTGSQGLEFTDLDGLDLTEAVTISAWIKPKLGVNNWQGIAVKSTLGGDGHDRNYGLWMHGTNKLIQISYFNPNNNNILLNSPSGLLVNDVWHHVAGVIDTENNYRAIYLNGELVASSNTDLAPMLPVSETFSIGMEMSGNNPIRHFTGLIDEVAIYDKALTVSEIKKIRDTTAKSSACTPNEAPGDKKIHVDPPDFSDKDFEPITRDLIHTSEFDEWNEDYDLWAIVQPEPEPETPTCTEPEVLDPVTNKCVIPEPETPTCTEPEVLDPVTNKCVIPEPETQPCGPGTYLKDGTCVIDDRCGPGTTMIDGTCMVDTPEAPPDTDGDGVPDDTDNCRTTFNSDQKDTDNDGLGNVCDSTPLGDERIGSQPIIAGDDGGGCLIATAAFGTELSTQVQQLRELRDNNLLQTESGSAFMSGFNQFYYSFSPVIADWERQNPVFKEVVKLTITPLITSLSLLNYVDMDSEAEVLGYGISLILLNVGMYVAVPVGIVVLVRRKI